MIKKVTNLFEVRKMMALAIVVLFCTLAVMQTIEVQFVQTVIISVISFYFGKTTEIKEKGGD